ncbi:MAG: IS30 family transposase [Chlamydiales bacterium]|jgi:IS30 family transposase
MPEDYHHLTRDQRCQLYTLKKRGDSVSIIAKELGVHPSTIYREQKRNIGKRGYRFKQANDKALERRQVASSQKAKMTSITFSIINEKLRLQWSPVQISGWLQKQVDVYQGAIESDKIMQPFFSPFSLLHQKSETAMSAMP